MKDPLQSVNAFDALVGRDDYSTGSVATVDTLIAWANLKDREFFESGDPRPKWHRERAEFAYRALGRLSRYGITKAFASELNVYLENMATRAYLRLDHKTGNVEWIFDRRLYLKEHKKTQTVFWIATLLQHGGLDGLAKCQMPGCGNFFVGTARKRWCSDTCGSRSRVRAKRKRDKERGNLESRYL